MQTAFASITEALRKLNFTVTVLSGVFVACVACVISLVGNVEAEPISLFWASSGLNQLPEVRFEFPFNMIGKSTMAFLTGQPCRVLKSRYTGGGPEQGFWRCFTGGLDKSLVSSVLIIGCLQFPGRSIF